MSKSKFEKLMAEVTPRAVTAGMNYDAATKLRTPKLNKTTGLPEFEITVAVETEVKKGEKGQEVVLKGIEYEKINSLIQLPVDVKSLVELEMFEMPIKGTSNVATYFKIVRLVEPTSNSASTSVKKAA